jgi:hypothetical protein
VCIFYIIVHCIIAPPEIIVEPGHKTVSVGDQLRLACEAIGVPEPSITWAKDDINIEFGQRVQVRFFIRDFIVQ